MNKQNSYISFETVGFLIRHPWCFVYPFVIILCTTFSFIINAPDIYECEAVLSLGGTGIEGSSIKFAQRKYSLVAKVLFGKSIKGVVEKAWPNVTEEGTPQRYDALVNFLRNSKKGLSLTYDKRDESFLHVVFRNRRPDIAYKVVRATVDTLISENEKAFEMSTEASIEYLTQQLNIYKDKLAAIDAGMLQESAKLDGMAAALSPEQREFVYRIAAESDMEADGSSAVAGVARSADILMEIEAKLAEARRNKQILELRVERKDFRPLGGGETYRIRQDVLDKAIEDKKLAMFELLAKGYLPEHPDVQRLEEGIKGLEGLRGVSPLARAQVGKLSEDEQKIAEQQMRNELKNLELTIEVLQNEKTDLEARRKASDDKVPGEESLVGPVAAQASKLRDLKSEKKVAARYYNDLRKQLEDTDLKSRAEKASTGFKIEVVEPPEMPVAPLPAQKGARFFLGLIMAISAGLAFSYLVDSLDKSIRSAGELRGKFKVPVLASIGRIHTMQDVKAGRLRRNTILISMAALSAIAMIAVWITTKL